MSGLSRELMRGESVASRLRFSRGHFRQLAGQLAGPLAGMAMLAGALTTHAYAEAPSLGGTWRAGATTIDVAVESWGGDCGPRPSGSKSAGGGVVNLAQDGKQLVIHGRDQDIRSDACWSRNPLMHKQSSSVVDGLWTTSCKTAANDPREEQGTYSLKLMGPDTLLYQDVSRYNWALNESHCVATFTTTQTLVRAHDGATAAVGTKEQPVKTSTQQEQQAQQNTAAPAPDPVERACTPGAPSRISVRPKHAEIGIGERVCLRARVTDAADCVVKGAAVEWSLAHGKAVKGTLEGGCFNAAASAAEAEGEFKISASAAGSHADAIVVVKSVDLSALIAKRMESGGALNAFAEQTPVAAAPKAAAHITTRTVSEPAKGSQPWALWISLGIGLVALGLVVARTVLRKPEPTSAARSSLSPRSSQNAPVIGNVGETTAGTRKARASAATQLVDSDSSSTTSAGAAGSSSHKPPPGDVADATPWICPTCRLGYPADRKTCPKDGTALMPYSEFSKRAQADEQAHQRRCPKCAKVFPANTAFCGDDGTSLVDV